MDVKTGEGRVAAAVGGGGGRLAKRRYHRHKSDSGPTLMRGRRPARRPTRREIRSDSGLSAVNGGGYTSRGPGTAPGTGHRAAGRVAV